MSRFSRYDTDEERLPEGMQRVGYDADTQVYTFQDRDGSYWESAPGSEYGQLTRVSDGPHEDAADNEPFLIHDDARRARPTTSWRTDMRPFLNFGLIIGLCLLLLFWFLYRSAGSDTEPHPQCLDGTTAYTIKKGDTCWAIGDAKGIAVDDILKANKGLDCDKLSVGSQICLPA